MCPDKYYFELILILNLSLHSYQSLPKDTYHNTNVLVNMPPSIQDIEIFNSSLMIHEQQHPHHLCKMILKKLDNLYSDILVHYQKTSAHFDGAYSNILPPETKQILSISCMWNIKEKENIYRRTEANSNNYISLIQAINNITA